MFYSSLLHLNPLLYICALNLYLKDIIFPLTAQWLGGVSMPARATVPAHPRHFHYPKKINGAF